MQMNFFTKQKDSQTWKTNLWLPKRKAGGRGINQEFGSNIYTQLYIKQINQQGPNVQHRELYSIFCNNYMGKESEKEYIYIYIYIYIYN